MQDFSMYIEQLQSVCMQASTPSDVSMYMHVQLPPTPMFITRTYMCTQAVTRITNYIISAIDIIYAEDLLMVGNHCMTEMSKCLQGHFASCSSAVASYILQQLDDQEMLSQEHSSSVVKLLSQVLLDGSIWCVCLVSLTTILT